MLKLFTATIFAALVAPTFASTVNNGQWYACIVKSGSHTGRYTFKIETGPCMVYWREIDSDLTIRDCNFPVIAALKPSARDNLSVVWFHMGTGAFYDYLSGFKDRGWCTPLDKEPK